MYKATIVLDSIAPSGVRLTTMEVTFPRIVLAEFNTHRTLSRNSASSRAIPFAKMLKSVTENPFIPEEWGANQPGMQAGDTLPADASKEAKKIWLEARDKSVDQAKKLHDMGIHKQLVNRLLEPFLWHTVLVTSTTWENFLNLRTHPDAQPQMQRAAIQMRDALNSSTPKSVGALGWHLPFVDAADRICLSEADALLVSAGRCARLSYLTHHGKRDFQEDIMLAKKLRSSGHMSPFEHQARAQMDPFTQSGNFTGWQQYRKTIPGEDVFKNKSS